MRRAARARRVAKKPARAPTALQRAMLAKLASGFLPAAPLVVTSATGTGVETEIRAGALASARMLPSTIQTTELATAVQLQALQKIGPDSIPGDHQASVCNVQNQR